MKIKSKPFLIFVIIALVAAGFYFYRGTRSQSPSPTSPTTGSLEVEEGISSPATGKDEQPDIEVVAENLEIPWEIAFLPSGELLVTERPGRLLKIGQDKKAFQIS